MQEVARHNGGFLLLWVIAIGFAGYALWRFSEAAFGVVGKGKRPRKGPAAEVAGTRRDLRLLGRQRLQPAGPCPRKSQASQQQLLTTKVMQHAAGRWVVGIAGAVVIGSAWR